MRPSFAFCMIAALLVSALPLAANTYKIDTLLSENTLTLLSDGSGTRPLDTRPVTRITGEITTDGTLGALDADNFVSWRFLANGYAFLSSEAVFSTPYTDLSGFETTVTNSGLDLFFATATSLSVLAGNWSFGGISLAGGTSQGAYFGTLGGLDSFGASGLTLMFEQSSAPTARAAAPTVIRDLASNTNFTSGIIAQIETIPVVPLSASLPFALGGITLLLGLRRRRSTQRRPATGNRQTTRS